LLLAFLCCFFFFFSSRRRHTRFSRDWSSDVCSSDLSSPSGRAHRGTRTGGRAVYQGPQSHRLYQCRGGGGGADPGGALPLGGSRSEERRVGKEWRSRWSAEPS